MRLHHGPYARSINACDTADLGGAAVSERDDGGLAFPHHEVWDAEKTEIGWIGGGMTLRDWFAGQARIAIGTWTPDHWKPAPLGANPEAWSAQCDLLARQARAAYCYAEADAMIAERNKP